MITEWSRDGPEGNRTLIAFATGRSLGRTTGRAEPYRTLAKASFRTGGALQDAALRLL